MTIRERLQRLDRAQRSMPFKVIASVILIVLGIAAISTYYVVVSLPGQKQAAAATQLPPEPAPAAEGAAQPAPMTAEERSALESMQRLYSELLQARTSPTNVTLGILGLTGVGLVVIWLGLGLTYLALAAAAASIAYPLSLLGLSGLSRMLLGIVALTAAFTALMQGLRALFSGPGPVFAIARNMLIEATRMKISMVFIVLLIFVMAALPGSLSQDTPLRYRVQSFLQYGTGGSFWIIAILVLFFSAASVSFEQRDKQIWQTMTKPVSSAQYILGKWLGVCGLSAALLAICCAGVFLFTEYLRQQPAVGESKILTAGAQVVISEDREILEKQVLTARRATSPEIPLSMDDPNFKKGADQFILDNRSRDPQFAMDQGTYDKVVSDLYKSLLMQWRSIAPAQYKSYMFRGLQEARNSGEKVNLRYRVDAGSNAPDALYHLTFVIGGAIFPPQDVTLGPTHSLQFPQELISENGDVEVTIHNGSVGFTEAGQPLIQPNEGTISIPPDGLELNYRAGSYQANFLRVAVVLWIKLMFLAMLAITAATFLSFPVACLVAFAVFLVAEGTGFLSLSLEYYDAVNPGEKVVYYKMLVRTIGLSVAWMFKTYSELKPTAKLVDGRLLAWSSVLWGTTVLVFWSALLYGTAVLIFRKRELATYSGQ